MLYLMPPAWDDRAARTRSRDQEPEPESWQEAEQTLGGRHLALALSQTALLLMVSWGLLISCL